MSNKDALQMIIESTYCNVTLYWKYAPNVPHSMMPIIKTPETVSTEIQRQQYFPSLHSSSLSEKQRKEAPFKTDSQKLVDGNKRK